MATLVHTARFFLAECKGDDTRKQCPAAWAKPALPYPCLLINLSLVTCPSTMPLLIHQVRPALANGKEIHRSGETYLLNYRGETYLPNAAPATCQAESLPDWYLI